MTETTLPPKVAEAFDEIDDCMRMHIKIVPVGPLKVVREYCDRLAEENARLLAANRDCVDHFEQMRGELAALKARIAEARRVMLGTYPAHGSGYVQIVSDPANGIGDETFALLKLEDGERE